MRRKSSTSKPRPQGKASRGDDGVSLCPCGAVVLLPAPDRRPSRPSADEETLRFIESLDDPVPDAPA